MKPLCLAISFSLALTGVAQSQSLEGLIAGEMTFSLEEYGDLVRTNFRASASGHSNGIAYTLTGAAFLPLLAVVLIVLNSQKRWLDEHRNHPITIAALVVTIAMFVTAGVFKFM